MGAQISFYEKSKCDISLSNLDASATQGDDYVTNLFDRSNATAWVTTGSVDADNTTITIDMVDLKRVTDIFLLVHNFKSYTVKYWNGSAYVAFSPAIAPTTNTAASTHYAVASVDTTKIQIIILGTQTANADKYLYQFVATKLIGTLEGWPVIGKPTHGTNIQKSMMLSGKQHITRNVGGFSCELSVKNWVSDDDLSIIEELYDSLEGFLVWLSGGNTTQFSSIRKGYRLEDLFLMKCTDDYTPEFYEGMYQSGIKISMKLGEVVA